MSKKRFAVANILVVGLLLVVGFIWIYPFFWVLFASFKTQREMFTAGAQLWPDVWDFSNFVRAWVKANFNIYFMNSVLYSVASTGVEVVKSALCGYVLARYQFPGRDLLYKIILATLFIPIASVILPQFMLIQELGLLNTRTGVILALSGGAGALYVLLYTNFFAAIPKEIFDAARVDGANFWQTFKLVWPLARPITATVIIFHFLHTWNEFNIPLIFTFSKPELRNLAVGMFAFQGEYSFDWTGFAAGTVISIIPVLIVFLLFQNYFVRGLAGAVKE